METYKRAGFACNCLLGVEMTLSTAAFWAHVFSEPKLSGFLVALLLTAAFGSVSLLASGLFGRLILARETSQWFTFASVILPENKRLENWTSPALIIDGDENEEIEIYRAADPGDPEAGRERRACA